MAYPGFLAAGVFGGAFITGPPKMDLRPSVSFMSTVFVRVFPSLVRGAVAFERTLSVMIFVNSIESRRKRSTSHRVNLAPVRSE